MCTDRHRNGDSPIRLTRRSLKVLCFLLEHPCTGHSAYDISKATGLWSGTLYPILMYFESAGWLSSEWESQTLYEAGKPRLLLYKLTNVGEERARAALSDLPQS